MKMYKLYLQCRLVEVNEVAVEPDPDDRPIDPVARDEEHFDPGKMANRMAKEMSKAFPGFGQRRAISPSEVAIRQFYDVPAKSLSDAAGLLKRFEDLCAEIGMPAAPGAETDFIPSYPAYGEH